MSHWRRVPRINVLASGGAGAGSSKILLAALIVIVLLEAAYVGLLLQGSAADQNAARTARTRLQPVQQDLAAELATVEQLTGRVDEARRRVEAAATGFDRIAAGGTDWYGGVSALLEARIDGVAFTSITAGPDGTIGLKGTAADLDAMARFQAELRDASKSLGLLSISFESASSALSFTVSLEVLP